MERILGLRAGTRGMVRMPPRTRKERACALVLAAAIACSTGCDVHANWKAPQTEAEASNYQRTSTSAQVDAFVAACVARSGRLRRLTIGESTRKKPLHLVLAAEPPVATLEAARQDPRLKVLVMANIHAGEVEGKEAVQVFLREVAQDLHEDVLRKVIVAFVPNYNPDGNDEIDRRHRPDQAGPVEGVGVRHNGAGLDLNRDYVKVEAPETEALIRAVRALDAALVVDLHTTDGSFHGFDLTYAGPLHPATDSAILDFERKTFLPGLKERMRAAGFETFDYGNWVDAARPASGWASFEARPRFGNSYFGLRNRLTLLSEAYSHDPFEKRIRATHALIRESLGLVAGQEAAIKKLVLDADARAAGLFRAGASLPTGAKLVLTEASRPIPVGGVREEKDAVTGLVRQWDDDVSKPVNMPVYAWFEGTNERAVFEAWIVPQASQKLLRVLEIHGIQTSVLAEARPAQVDCFRIDSETAESSPFQGHRLKTFAGKWASESFLIPKGALYVPAAQPLARLAFILFQPESDDGLGAWGLIDVVGDDRSTTTRFGAVRFVSWAGR
jgi:hypothetical protein